MLEIPIYPIKWETSSKSNFFLGHVILSEQTAKKHQISPDFIITLHYVLLVIMYNILLLKNQKKNLQLFQLLHHPKILHDIVYMCLFIDLYRFSVKRPQCVYSIICGK